jgi:hypothetical protein
MAAIITDDFRRNQAELLVNDIKASLDSAYNEGTPTSTMQDRYRTNSIYAIGLGKTDKWPDDILGKSEDTLDFVITPPGGTQQEDEDVINNLFTLKEVSATGVHQLIAKNAWTQTRKYKVYDATDNDCYYVTGDVYPSYVTHNGQLYLCVSNTALSNATANPIGANTPPTHTGQTIASTNDGYVWVHLQALPTSGSKTKFITPQFVPVLAVDPVADAATITNSTTLQGGVLSHIGLVDGGSGYTATTTVTVTAVKTDGTEQDLSAYQFVPIISASGVVERIVIQASGTTGDTGNLTYWSGTPLLGLRSATVKIEDVNQASTSREASAFALVSPNRGWATDAAGTLPTWFVGVIAEFVGTEGGDAQALKFRQVSLVKNFVRNDDSDGSTVSYDALKYIDCASIVSLSLEPGDVLEQAGSGAKFYFDYVNGTNLFYHQNSTAAVNTIDPIAGSNAITVAVSQSGNVSPGVTVVSSVNGISDGEFPHRDSVNNEFNGEVVFLENRVPFTRAATQTEEVKLIVQL